MVTHDGYAMTINYDNPAFAMTEARAERLSDWIRDAKGEYYSINFIAQ